MRTLINKGNMTWISLYVSFLITPDQNVTTF